MTNASRVRCGIASAVLTLSLCTVGHDAAAQASSVAYDDSVAALLHRAAENGTLPGLNWERFAPYQDELQALYSASGWQPLWSTRGRPDANARAAIDALLRADQLGLRPDDYDADLLDHRARGLSSAAHLTARDVAWFDLALSVDLMRHVRNVRIGRVNPKHLDVGLDIEPKKLDLALELRRALHRGQIAEMVRDAEPTFVQYRALKAAYARYRSLAAGPALTPIAAPAAVRPGERFDGADALRRRLAATGDLAATAMVAAGADADLYDDATAGAVARYQERNGLAADSVLGASTLAAINVPFAKRARQIELAMERIRWLPALDTGPFVIVNVPSFQLYAFDTLDSRGTPTLTMNVVVGRDQVGRRTPLFERDMKYLVFRPYWVITRNITRKETLPAVRKNRGYLERNNMEIYSGSGDTGPAVATTSANLDRVARGELGIRQRPGPKNSLGLAKFIFPNDHNVYMHGTPATELFSRTRRDFSHGCIRLEDPAKFAVWVLRDPVTWSPADVRQAMDARKPRPVNLARPLPVVIYYTTAVARPDGSVMFLDDIYRHDAKLEAALAKGYPFAP